MSARMVPSLQDYYAGAIALFGIILFTKFATHARNGTRSRNPEDKKWPWQSVFHVLCVSAAVIGAASCFAVLGWTINISVLGCNVNEESLRWVVAITAGFSGVVLAVEVGFTRRGG